MAAEIIVTRADGASQTVRVSADATRATASEETATCDGAARAFDCSAIKLANEVRLAMSEFTASRSHTMRPLNNEFA